MGNSSTKENYGKIPNQQHKPQPQPQPQPQHQPQPVVMSQDYIGNGWAACNPSHRCHDGTYMCSQAHKHGLCFGEGVL